MANAFRGHSEHSPEREAVAAEEAALANAFRGQNFQEQEDNMSKQESSRAQRKREAYATFEKTVLDLYEQSTLTLEQLNRIARQYQDVEIDSAGSQQRLTFDEKDLAQVCIELEDPSFPLATRRSHDDHDEYWERELQKWEEVIHQRWGWNAYNFPGIA
ncbi:hypothetical protein [Ktedonospora formicarum]|uniref:Uncharacterized protein n=1 Tax=Ktedonospora formicarum TaxID=2778364 RepID=A0A8J3I6I2_9CHLR|nr:hypothetical protein [Ktedonospora formicarum]GHO48008.1 hypothetical protein KSX_61710 [Ktedonospora formicarum]